MRFALRFAIVIAFTAATVAAQSVAPPPKPLYLRGDHWTPYAPPTEFPPGTQVYTIVRGDTLWDLAQKNLGDPYLWPQIWERNPYILDSHWIYPGDPLVIDVAVQPPPAAEPQAAGVVQEHAGPGIAVDKLAVYKGAKLSAVAVGQCHKGPVVAIIGKIESVLEHQSSGIDAIGVRE